MCIYSVTEDILIRYTAKQLEALEYRKKYEQL